MMETSAAGGCSHHGLVHDALLYGTDDVYVTELRAFVEEGFEGGAVALVAVPGSRLSLLETALAGSGGAIRFVDMQEQGRNPARILPFIEAFLDLHAGQPVRFVGEPIWGGRTAAEIVEGHRHEALINAAFADRPAHIVCPYDTRSLAPGVIEDARRTHPTVLESGRRRACDAYADPMAVYAAHGHPLPEPATEWAAISFADGLAPFRRRIEEHALRAGLVPERVTNLVLAANEAAANTLKHAGGDGAARIWTDERELVCELTDVGLVRIRSSGAPGRRRPTPRGEGSG